VEVEVVEQWEEVLHHLWLIHKVSKIVKPTIEGQLILLQLEVV
jgi:hypothetical protein